MAKEEKSMMPQSTAGLVRYFNVEEGIKVKPETVIWLSSGLAAVVIILKLFA